MTALADIRMTPGLRDLLRRLGPVKTVEDLRGAMSKIHANADRKEANSIIDRHIHQAGDWRAEVCRVHELAKKRIEPWTQEDRRFLALKLMGEAGQLANLIAKDWRGDGYSPDRRAEARSLMVDVRIYLELLSAWHEVDLDAMCVATLPKLHRRWPETAPKGGEA